jgi:hypothetical protein
MLNYRFGLVVDPALFPAAKTATKRAFWLRLEVATRIEEIQALNFSRAGYQTVVLTNSRALK